MNHSISQKHNFISHEHHQFRKKDYPFTKIRDFIQMTHKSYFKSGPEIWHIKIFELLAKDAWGFKVPKHFFISVFGWSQR